MGIDEGFAFKGKLAMYRFLVPLLLGFAFNSASAFTAAHSARLGSDPSPFDHSTKIAVMEVRRKEK